MHGQDTTQGHFFSVVYQVFIQNFPSPTPFALPGLKKPACPIIYLKKEGE